MLVFVTSLLTAISGFMGTSFLRAIRIGYGAVVFWVTGLVVSVVFVSIQAEALALLLAGFWILIGIYSEFLNHGFRWANAGLMALCGAMFGFMGGFILILHQHGIDNYNAYLSFISEGLSQMEAMMKGVKFETKRVAELVPGVVASLLVLGLGKAILFERRATVAFGLTYERRAGFPKWLQVKMPDGFVWFSLFVFLFSMINFGYEPLRLLAINLCLPILTIYLFQGLAVFESLLVFLRTGPFTRLLIYFFIVGNLFPLLSPIGLIDYWLDFRGRLQKFKAPESQ